MRVNSQKILSIIAKGERAVIVIGFIAMTLLLLIDTLGREFFGRGLFGANIIAVYILIYTAMAGFGVATATGGHLRPNFLDKVGDRIGEAFVVRIGQILTAVLAIMMTIGAIQFVRVTAQFAESNPIIGVPLWPFQMALPIGFGIAAIRHIIYSVQPSLIPADEEPV